MNSRIEALKRRYSASIRLAQDGVEIVAVGDPAGDRFNLAVRSLIAAIREDGPGLWDDLAAVAKVLRWRLITQPQPMIFNQRLTDLAGEVSRQADCLQNAVADRDLLDEIAASAKALAQPDRKSPVGTELLSMCIEAGADTCVVVTASKSDQLALASWLTTHGILVMTARDLERDQPDLEQAYLVGPPRIFPASLITAPVIDAVSYVLPAWFGDRSIPCSAISQYAEGAICIRAREYTVGDTSEPGSITSVEVEDEDTYLPQPVWGAQNSDDREPTSDEVCARKVLLSGGLAILLDDGERIRSLDPRQPTGERVTYTDVAAVRIGTYLLLREGVTEQAALHQAALDKLGSLATEVKTTQEKWKECLAQRLEQRGYRQVVEELRAAGVKAADRAQAWTAPNLIRPHSDHDFKSLLKWLGIQIQPTFENASCLRKKHYQASADITRQLEVAVSAADLTELESNGNLSLDVETEGFRGILATRVIAISPQSRIVPRRNARVLFEDRSGEWLE